MEATNAQDAPAQELGFLWTKWRVEAIGDDGLTGYRTGYKCLTTMDRT